MKLALKLKRFFLLLLTLFLTTTSSGAARQLGPFFELWGIDDANEMGIGNPLPVTLIPYSQSPVVVSLDQGLRATYYATSDYFTPAATATDVVGILGSDTTTVKILRVTLSSTQNVAGINKWFLIKRSTADSGGTPTAATLITADSNDAAATAIVRRYGSNPTLGTAVGTTRALSILSPAPASLVEQSEGTTVLYDAKATGKAIILRSSAQGLYLNFAGAAVPAGLDIAVNIVFTEE